MKYAEEIYEYLRTIPKGKVVTYGQIAAYLGNPKLARAVGNVLHANKNPDFYPCFRVVNREGCLAANFGAEGGEENQKERLEADGIEVLPVEPGSHASLRSKYRVELQRYQWQPEEDTE